MEVEMLPHPRSGLARLTSMIALALAAAVWVLGARSERGQPAWANMVTWSGAAQLAGRQLGYLPLALNSHAGGFAAVPTAAASPTLALSATPTLTPSPTLTPAPTSTPTATRTPTVTPTPTVTASPTPSPTLTLTPSVTPTPSATYAVPDWLAYVNYHRALAQLPPAIENTAWSRGDELHSRYMVKNDQIGHSERAGRPFYSPEGHEAGQNGNVFGTSWIDADYEDSIDMWMVGPFHMVAIIDPELAVTGYGDYREDIGRIHFAATLDVLRGRESIPPAVKFPVYYPRDGGTIPNLAYTGNESPDPLLGCPGYRPNTGAPIALQLGGGGITPDVRRSSFRQGDTELEHCVFDETTYPASLGQRILGSRDAIILMPRLPLQPGGQYTVVIEANGTVYSWSFTAGGRRQAPARRAGDPRLVPPAMLKR